MSSCSKCGYVWQYRGDRVITACPSCKQDVVIKPSIYQTIKEEKNRYKQPYHCDKCGYNGLVKRGIISVTCGCGEIITFRKRRKNGFFPYTQNQVVKYIEQHPNCIIWDINGGCKLNYATTASALKNLMTKKLITRKKVNNPNFGKSDFIHKNVWGYSTLANQ